MTELNLAHLGKQSEIQTDPDKVILDRIPKPNSDLLYSCRFTIPEYSSLCPVTGQPDYALLIIDYVPDKYLVESKSLKLWMFSYRQHGSFHEAVTTDIGYRLYKELQPHWLRVAGFFNGRGGISIDIVWEGGGLPPNVKPLSIDNVKLYNNGHW